MMEKTNTKIEKSILGPNKKLNDTGRIFLQEIMEGKNLDLEKQSTSVLFDFLGGDFDQIKHDIAVVDFLGKKIVVHKYLKEVLEKIQNEVRSDPKAKRYKIKSVGGYNPRKVRDYKDTQYSGQISAHSLGLAIDINPKENGFLPYKTSGRNCKIPKVFVDIMKKNGFIWGGDWQTPYDPMHFEFSILNKLLYQKLLYDVKHNKK
ncbi:MAG: M15 family metallopeptidase [Candidatus Gracilibacteria bacterium]|nr:M15 family metallopeptidase [Candidatus Gracilibacteria bacterium]